MLVATALAVLSISFVEGSCIHDFPLRNLRRSPQVAGRDVPVNNFTYVGVTGPLGWTGLSTANVKCSTANVQSPINIDHSVIPFSTSHPQINIPNVESAEFENLGTTVEVVINGTTTFEGKAYSLKQYHFHTPAEHLIDAPFYPMEAHFVHTALDGTYLVLAALFELSLNGTNTKFLDPLLSGPLHAIEKPGSSAYTGPLDFSEITQFFSTVPLFKYTGSLTTPPCTDGVTWLVAGTFLPVTPQAFLEFKSVLKFNARYVQNTPGQQNLIELAASQLPK
ncbi:hypothetical protein K443DRAFT_96672 [Laccaria amethystina LaAM-08-1]|uniref:carbonic anhydrase n=1 Tax=Laccaria amethystina LaAM-08-1 TaxID=1095629 RepID=A0A0C9WTY7_9AGAR|nr:hypothetical protein K443DRAFT_96672 [Laccaria amethystina LaAM-08-1]